MSHRVKTSFLIAVATVIVSVSSMASAQQRWTVVRTEQSEAANKIFATLDEDTTLEFIETPLTDVVAFLSELHNINILLDTKALEEVGISSDTPITRNLKGISLRSALRLMLRDLELTYVVADEVLQITTPEQASELTQLSVYNVSPMLEKNEPADSLALTLEQALAKPHRKSPMSSATPFGSAQSGPKTKTRTITVYGQLLIVRDSPEGHQALAALLDAISDAQAAFEEAPATKASPKGESSD
jgi:hypothetical protein